MVEPFQWQAQAKSGGTMRAIFLACLLVLGATAVHAQTKTFVQSDITLEGIRIHGISLTISRVHDNATAKPLVYVTATYAVTNFGNKGSRTGVPIFVRLLDKNRNDKTLPAPGVMYVQPFNFTAARECRTLEGPSLSEARSVPPDFFDLTQDLIMIVGDEQPFGCVH
ncbi:MAG: hypothetical protein JSR47_24675 [Proteobacteria bacterium]|nr:hypothetical protein [Pseudomonadota bacterium]MBS0548772.1 hypothetical protein [Pseudomonadota bacterium]